MIKTDFEPRLGGNSTPWHALYASKGTSQVMIDGLPRHSRQR